MMISSPLLISPAGRQEEPGVCLYRAAPCPDARDARRDFDRHLLPAAHRARQHRRYPVCRGRLCRPRRQGQSAARARHRSADGGAISALDQRAVARRPRLFLRLREAGAGRNPAADSDHRAARGAGAVVLRLGRHSPRGHQRGPSGIAARLFPARGQPLRTVAAIVLARPSDPDGVGFAVRQHPDLQPQPADLRRDVFDLCACPRWRSASAAPR